MAEEPKKAALWVGRVLSALPLLMFMGSATMKLTHNPMVIDQMVGKFGFSAGAITAIGVLEITCAILYAIPRTAVLGAILLTGYLGGAVVTHLRIGDPWIMPVLLGVLLWVGLYLREPRLRALAPLRSSD